MAIIQLSAATIEALKIAARLLLLHQWWQQDANSSLDTNESLEFQSQHQMSDVAGWHFATCSGVPLYFVLACTWSKATLGSDNHSHGSWTNIVMAPTDTSARSFSSTSSCIKKKSNSPSISHHCWKRSAEPHNLYLLHVRYVWKGSCLTPTLAHRFLFWWRSHLNETALMLSTGHWNS